ncbi:MFS general substrate transporter [Mycena amicta]|nr:MFS general substrate transporter [Mycena amicta]
MLTLWTDNLLWLVGFLRVFGFSKLGRASVPVYNPSDLACVLIFPTTMASQDIVLESIGNGMLKPEKQLDGPAPSLSQLPALAAEAPEEIQTPPTRPSAKQRGVETVQLAALCWALAISGWNDGTLGPLIPRIQEEFHIGYTTVSLIFVFRCIGCLVGSLATILLAPKFAFGKMLILGALTLGLGNIFQATAMLPYPVFIMGAFVSGIGFAMQNAGATAYVASLTDNSEFKMGLFQASYGAGALVAPFVSTQFAQLRHWSYHFFISVGLSAFSAVLFLVVFRGLTQDECHARIGQAAGEKEAILPNGERKQRSELRQIVSSPAVHVLALFLFVYVGTEVTIGGWIVSFMITVRHGGTSAGYISSGFFGGMMISRLLLIPVTRLIGQNRAVYLYGALSIGLELIIWLVPSFLGSAISVSVVGMLLGPLYPIAMSHAARAFHPWLLSASISWVSGIATSGAAVFPFATGAIAARVGIRSLEPVVVGMLTFMLVLWAIVMRTRM